MLDKKKLIHKKKVAFLLNSADQYDNLKVSQPNFFSLDFKLNYIKVALV